MERLMVLHLTDSRGDCGSRIDRHEHIGKGMIGKEPFRWIMNDNRLKDITKIIENPKAGSKDRDNLQLLRSFCN